MHVKSRRTANSKAAHRASGPRLAPSPGPTGLYRLTRRIVSVGLTAFAGIITVLHLWLLWQRLADPGRLELTVALRWLGAAALLAILVQFRRLRISLLWGDKALVFWLLVLLLHVHSPAPFLADGEIFTTATGPSADQILLILPVSLTLTVLSRNLLRKLRLRSNAAALRIRLRRPGIVLPLLLPQPRSGFCSTLAPRAPPV